MHIDPCDCFAPRFSSSRLLRVGARLWRGRAQAVRTPPRWAEQPVMIEPLAIDTGAHLRADDDGEDRFDFSGRVLIEGDDQQAVVAWRPGRVPVEVLSSNGRRCGPSNRTCRDTFGLRNDTVDS